MSEINTGAGPSAAPSVESGSTPSGAETTATPITPETPSMPDGIPSETNPDDKTGVDTANILTDQVSEKVAPGDLLENIANGKTLTASSNPDILKDYNNMMNPKPDGDEPSIKPDENPVTFGNADEYRKNFASVQADDDINGPTEITDKNDTNTPPDTKDQAPASSPTEAVTEVKTDVNKEELFTTPGDAENQIKQQDNMQADEKTTDGEKKDKKDEKDENQKSEKEKQIEEKMQMADIVSQIKDFNPDFDPKNPEAQDFLKNLAENSDQMNTAADTLKMLGEQKTVLENSEAIKNLGINPKDLVVPAAIDTLKALSNTIEKSMNELASKPNLTKEEKDKKEKDGILLLLLKMLGKAMGTALVVGGAAALTVGKEMKK